MLRSIGITKRAFSFSLRNKTSSVVVEGNEALMSQKENGTCKFQIQKNLRFGCSSSLADEICCFNRHYAEHSGYFDGTSWLAEIKGKGPVKYFDSTSGKLLFTAPIDRTEEEFLKETMLHGWPSFRDPEVNWEFVRVLPNGECVSIDGTHLGHNIPDGKGNRYCINLVSIAGNEMQVKE